METERPTNLFGPEYVIEVFDPKLGMRGVLVIDSTARGPAKGGIIWEGGDEKKKKTFVQSFARALTPFLVTKYISAPDVNTGEKEMAWFVGAAGNRKAATG